MRLRARRRRHVVIWSSSAGPAGRYAGLRRAWPARSGRIRRGIHTGVLLTVMGLLGLSRSGPWRAALAGAGLTLAGIMLRGGPGGVVLLPGLLLLLSAPLIPGVTAEDRERRAGLERELAAYSTQAERRDLEATLDQYPDRVTYELRDILAGQDVAACHHGIPGTRRY